MLNSNTEAILETKAEAVKSGGIDESFWKTGYQRCYWATGVSVEKGDEGHSSSPGFPAAERVFWASLPSQVYNNPLTLDNLSMSLPCNLKERNIT